MKKSKQVIDDKIKDILINFAKKNPKGVKAVFKGRDPEERRTIYYLITLFVEYNRNFEDKITKLNLSIEREFKGSFGINKSVSLMVWPNVNPGDYGFFGECLYKVA